MRRVKSKKDPRHIVGSKTNFGLETFPLFFLDFIGRGFFCIIDSDAGVTYHC